MGVQFLTPSLSRRSRTIRPFTRFLVLSAVTAFASLSLGSGTWQQIANQPSFNACTMQLLTDGRVLVQAYYNDPSNWILTPDANGNYVNGTWTKVASMHYYRLYYASSVLADGRVLVCGGEYSNGGSETNKCEIYDPIANTWTDVAAPTGWNSIGDAACMVLPDGKFMLGSIFDQRTSIWDPATGVWTAGPNKSDQLGTEETWTLLPDNTVLCLKCWNHPGSEKYVWPNNIWVDSGNLPIDLVDSSSYEVGGGVLMPDGRCFHIGATPYSALYTMPSNPLDPGTWTRGPDTPVVNGKSLVAADAPLAIMPNGKVIMALGPYVPGGFGQPTYMCEYDGTSIYRIPDPGNSNVLPYNSRMMLLPTGQVLFTSSDKRVWIYTPDGTYNPAWAPAITVSPSLVQLGNSYPLTGTQFNGISQGTSYGDDAWAPTNYPLVRIKNFATGHTTYCRTYGHSTMGVATGLTPVSTNFQVPNTIDQGPGILSVVANGIPSPPVRVDVGTQNTLPASYTVVRGSLVGGALPNVFFSDDGYMTFKPAFAGAAIGPPLQVQFDSVSPSPAPTSFKFQLEASVTQGGETQVIGLFNFQTGKYEFYASQNATTTDSILTVTMAGDLSRFIGAGNAIRAKIMYSPQVTQLSNWQAKLDVVNWIIQ